MPDSLVFAADGASAVVIDAVAAEALPATLSAMPAAAARWLGATGFSAAAGEVALIPDGKGGLNSVLFGLGKADGPPSLAAGKLPGVLPPGTYRLGEGFDDPALAALAFALGAYRFTRYREEKTGGLRQLVVPGGVDGAEIVRIADAVTLTRDLVNTGANDLGPAELADAARDLGRRHGAVVTEIVGEGPLAENFPLIHVVGAAAGATRKPRLIDLAWGREGDPAVTIVGKGVTFDTGGLDIKTAAGMLIMKKDMGGAANALGLASMIMGAELPIRLRVLIPAVENAISGNAFRPGDILKSRAGLTVEIGNTDAEGRLVLADALALAAEESPALIVDFATLTGAARVALGPEVVPFYTADDTLAADLARHAAAVADPVWRMPLWAPYASLIESKIADINNAGSTPFAGSITAALFLSRFVPDGQRWLHADMFAWTPSARPGRPEGGEAQVIRALYAMLKEPRDWS